MDKIEVFIRNVLSAWTLLLFIQKAASTLFTKSKVKKSAILCCAYGALGVIARCWFTYDTEHDTTTLRRSVRALFRAAAFAFYPSRHHSRHSSKIFWDFT